MAALNQTLCRFFVVSDALGMQTVVILAHGHIQSTINASSSHVYLHLCIVLRLGLLDTMLFKVGKRLDAVRLELDNVAFVG